MPKARVNGIGTYYHVRGEGTPVLFIHGGLAGTMREFLQQMPPADQPALAPRHYRLRPEDPIKLINYDRRCCGHSEYVLEEFTLEDLAADARALLERLGVDRSIVIGDCGGGPVALQYALQYPRRVAALGLVETFSTFDDMVIGEDLRHAFAQTRELIERARTEGYRAVFESRKEELRNPRLLALPSDCSLGAEDARRQFWELAALQAASDGDLFWYSTGSLISAAAYLGHDLTPRLGELKMPTCIIHGTADTWLPIEYGRILHRNIEQSEFYEIDGAQHGVLVLLSGRDARRKLRAWVLRMATSG